MNIKQVEEITGITKQNIRFYEKQALILPRRNPENDYRDYSDEDIRNLKIIKILRKLGMPIGEIRNVLTESVSLKDALEKRKQDLEIEKTAMEASIRFCAQLRPQSIQTLDTDSVLKNMEEEEKRGSVFLDFMNDFKLMANAEIKKYFSFMPDSMIKTPAEFSYELVKYAKENDLEIIITKESMYPEFTLDGVEFRAARNFGVLGAVVECKIAHPELVEPVGMSKKRKSMLKMLLYVLPIAVVFVIMVLLYLAQTGFQDMGEVLLFSMGIVAFIVSFVYLYRRV